MGTTGRACVPGSVTCAGRPLTRNLRSRCEQRDNRRSLVSSRTVRRAPGAGPKSAGRAAARLGGHGAVAVSPFPHAEWSSHVGIPGVDLDVSSLNNVLERGRMPGCAPRPARARIWPTGFSALDDVLSGGLRAGDLILLTGGPGPGQDDVARADGAATSRARGRHVLVLLLRARRRSRMLERLVALEVGEQNDRPGAPNLVRVRQAFEGVDNGSGGLAERLTHVRGAIPALERIMGYSDRLHVHRSSGNATSLTVITNAVEQVVAADRRGADGDRRLPAEGHVPRAAPTSRTSGSPWSSRGSRTSSLDTTGAGARRSSPPTRRASSPASGCASSTCAAPRRWPTRPTWC